jgi:urea transport system permease protein
MLAGIAGALYVPQVGIINPGEFNPINSIEIVIWVAVGGRASLYGAIVGAILVNYAKTVFTGIFPDGWLYALGLIFVLVTLFLPKGIVGIIGMIRAKQAERKALAAADAAREAAPAAEPAAAEAAPKEA